MGVTRYTNYIKDGHTVFTGPNNEQARAAPRYSEMVIAPEGNLLQLTSPFANRLQRQA